MDPREDLASNEETQSPGNELVQYCLSLVLARPSGPTQATSVPRRSMVRCPHIVPQASNIEAPRK